MVKRIFVKAKPGAKVANVKRLEEELFAAPTGERPPGRGGVSPRGTFDASFMVSVKEPAKEGRANRAIEKAIAEYFNIPPSRVRIVSGEASKEKVIEVN